MQKTANQEYAFAYEWNLAGGLRRIQYPSGRKVDYCTDAAGRVSLVHGETDCATAPGKPLYASSLGYAAHGAVRQMKLGNGLWETAEHNGRLQPTAVRLGTSAGGSERWGLGLGWDGGAADNNGNVRWQEITAPEFGVKQSFGYDPVNRIASATETLIANGTTNWSRGFGADAYGNAWVTAHTGVQPSPFTPVAESWFDNTTNRLTGTDVGFDVAGNQTKMGGYTFTVDGENRLRTSTINAATTTYEYDGAGRRVRKLSGAGTTVYVYSALGELAAEYGPATGEYGRQFVTADHLGSTRVVTDGAGAVVRRYDYLPYGEEIPAGVGGRTAALGYVAANGADAQTVKFTGQLRDAESGLDYFGARYLSSAQGRWTSPDKPFADQHIQDPQSWNLYSYVRNNPLRYVDDTGEGAREKLQGAWQGAKNAFDNTMVGFLTTVLAPDQAASGAWNGVKGLAQTVFTSEGRQAFTEGWSNMSEQEKAALVTEVGIGVAAMALSKGGSGEGLAASAARGFGFKSFGVRGALVGGELEGGGSALLGISRTAETLGVNVSMVSGPAGTLGKIEAGAISAARATGASSVEIRASMVKDSMGRLLRRNGFTQEMKDGKATGNWVKVIKLREENK